MISLPHYDIGSQIYESTTTKVFKGIRNSDNCPVILKIINTDDLSGAELIRFKNEYAIIQSLEIEGVVKAYGIEEYKNTSAIIFEDYNGRAIGELIKTRDYNLYDFLSIAINIVEVLGQIHGANIIHKDINPYNILMNPSTGVIKIIDFGLSTVMSQEAPVITTVLEGSLHYLSPEQTGRMNCTLDYRTDFYSLGITFYEILCRKRPFEGSDPLELVHSHIAKNPIPPFQISHKIPEQLSDIVIKLMAKNAGDRYQSAWGIKSDLEAALNQLNTDGKITFFPLGQYDISDKFHVSPKLYGRTKEITLLKNYLEKVSRGDCEMLMIEGHSGIGKTSLVREVCRPITLQPVILFPENLTGFSTIFPILPL
jgi:serine/threonine protein kinase